MTKKTTAQNTDIRLNKLTIMLDAKEKADKIAADAKKRCDEETREFYEAKLAKLLPDLARANQYCQLLAKLDKRDAFKHLMAVDQYCNYSNNTVRDYGLLAASKVSDYNGVPYCYCFINNQYKHCRNSHIVVLNDGTIARYYGDTGVSKTRLSVGDSDLRLSRFVSIVDNMERDIMALNEIVDAL